MLSLIVLFFLFVCVIIFIVCNELKLFQTEILPEKVLAYTTLAALCLAGFILLQKIMISPADLWNQIRLAWFISPWYGYDLYSGADSGPAISVIYGPVSALLYQPIGMIKSITAAVLAGSLMSAGWFFLPVLWGYCSYVRSCSKAWLYAVYAFTYFCFLSIMSLELRRISVLIHVDAAAIGLGVLACFFLVFEARENRLRNYVFSSVFCALSVWAKQIMAPLVIALPLFVFLRDGFPCLKKYALSLIVSLSFVSGAVLLAFHPHNLIFIMFLIPARAPWLYYWSGSTQIGTFFLNIPVYLLKESLLPLCLLVIYLIYQWAHIKQGVRSFSAWLRTNPWSLFILVSIFLLPTSLLARIKLGGINGNLAPVVTFFFVATGFIFMDSVKKGLLHASQGTRRVGMIALLALLVGLICVNIEQALHIKWAWDVISFNPYYKAYQYAKNHAGQVYFPSNPLITLLSEGKLYHHDWAIYERKLSGYELSPGHFKAHIPANTQQIIIPPESQEITLIKQYLPQFSEKTVMEEFPGWDVYQRPPVKNFTGR